MFKKTIKSKRLLISIFFSIFFLILNFLYFNATPSQTYTEFDISLVAPDIQIDLVRFEMYANKKINEFAARDGRLGANGTISRGFRANYFFELMSNDVQAMKLYEEFRQTLKAEAPKIGFEFVNFDDLDLTGRYPDQNGHVSGVFPKDGLGLHSFKLKPKFDVNGNPLNLFSASVDQALKATGNETLKLFLNSFNSSSYGFVHGDGYEVNLNIMNTFIDNYDFNLPYSSSTLHHETFSHAVNNLALGNGLTCSGCIDLTNVPLHEDMSYYSYMRSDELTASRRQVFDQLNFLINPLNGGMVRTVTNDLADQLVRTRDMSLTNIWLGKNIQNESQHQYFANKIFPDSRSGTRVNYVAALGHPSDPGKSDLTIPLSADVSAKFLDFKKNNPGDALPPELVTQIKNEVLTLGIHVEAEARHSYSQTIEALNLARSLNIESIDDNYKSNFILNAITDANKKGIQIDSNAALSLATQDSGVSVVGEVQNNQTNRNAVDSLTKAYNDYYPLLDATSTPSNIVINKTELAPQNIAEAQSKHNLSQNAFSYLMTGPGHVLSQNPNVSASVVQPKNPPNTNTTNDLASENTNQTINENKVESISHSTIQNYSSPHRAAVASGFAGGVMLSAADGLQAFGNEMAAYSAAMTAEEKQAVLDRVAVKVAQNLNSGIAFVTLVAAGTTGTFVVVGSAAGLAAGTAAATAVGVGVTAFYVGKSIEAIMFNRDGARDDLIAVFRDCADSGCQNLRNMVIGVAEIAIDAGRNAVDNPQVIIDGLVKTVVMFDRLLARVLNGENIELAVAKFAEEMTPNGSTSSGGNQAGGGNNSGSGDSSGGTVGGGREIASDTSGPNPVITDGSGNQIVNPQVPISAAHYLKNNFVPSSSYQGINFISNPNINVAPKVPEIINMWTNNRTPTTNSTTVVPPVVLTTMSPHQTPPQAEGVNIKTSLGSATTTIISNHLYSTPSGEKVQISDDVAKDRFSVWWPFSYSANTSDATINGQVQAGVPSQVQWSDGKSYTAQESYGIIKKEGTLITRADGQTFLMVATLSPKKGSYLKLDFASNQMSITKGAVSAHQLPLDQVNTQTKNYADINDPDADIPTIDISDDVTGAVPVENQNPKRGIPLDQNYPTNSRALIRTAAQGN